jgi:cation diffusion facilitator family transporter
MKDSHKQQVLSKTKTVTLLALVLNLLLFTVKLIFGIVTGSISLIADGIHSLSDMATDIGVMLGVYIGSREPDQSHPYGHGRAETFTALFISLILTGVGSGMIYFAALGIARQRTIEPAISIIAVAVISIIVKEFLYRVTKRTAVKYHSAALYANAWHQRSDALSSLAVAIGFITLKFGYRYGDHLAAIAVGLMIIFVAVKMLGQCLGEFAESAVDKQTIEHIKDIIESQSSIRQWHKLRTRTIASEIFLDLHILVDAELNINQAHEIAEQLENSLHEQISRPVNITVHVEPDIPELRK